MAWFLSPLGLKVGGGILLALALGIALRTMTNRAYNQGFDKGETSGINKLTEQKQKEWAERETAIHAREIEVAKILESIDADLRKSSLARETMRGDLNRGIGGLREEFRRSTGDIALIPASELDGRIIETLRGLR
jgi:hypothetical protein